MLFDLQGKRRRVVQATYLMLAVLMGGGLVLFGIGGETSGGLFDAFSSNDGGNNGSDVVQERVDRGEERVKQRPRDAAVREELVRDYYALASAQAPDDPNATAFPADARDELQRASVHWSAYLELQPRKPDPDIARVALQVYDPTGLNQPENALRAARIIAEQGKDSQSYLLLAQYAALASDTRTEKLASQKALDLAPSASDRRLIKDQLEQIKAAQAAQELQLNGGAANGGGQGGK